MASGRLDLSVLTIAVLLMLQSTLAAYGVRLVRDLFSVGRGSLVAVARHHQSNDSADVK
jgi:hypothetical protein